MTWTTEKPTQPGWYWWRHAKLTMNENKVVEVKQFSPTGVLYCHGNVSIPMNANEIQGGEWAGPLEPPKETP